MFRPALITLALVFTALSPAWAQPPFFGECKECHSKDPKMVRMHSALGFKNCFSCHGYVKELPIKERIGERPSDERCLPCHKS